MYTISGKACDSGSISVRHLGEAVLDGNMLEVPPLYSLYLYDFGWAFEHEVETDGIFYLRLRIRMAREGNEGVSIYTHTTETSFGYEKPEDALIYTNTSSLYDTLIVPSIKVYNSHSSEYRSLLYYSGWYVRFNLVAND